MQRILKLFTKPRIPVIRVSGVIDQKSGDKIQTQIDKISSKNICAIAVVVNSPGGLPVQSDLICEKLNILKKKYQVPLYTFAEDVAASGGYFVLCIGDRIYADHSSLIGSIGVISQWFGFKQALNKLGIDVKTIASNEKVHEITNDPFSDFNEENTKSWIEKLEITHEQFINHVKRYRNIQDQQAFKAEVYNGDDALKIGLIDEIGTLQNTIQKLHPGSKFEFVSFPTKMEELKSIIKKS